MGEKAERLARSHAGLCGRHEIGGRPQFSEFYAGASGGKRVTDSFTRVYRAWESLLADMRKRELIGS